MTCIRQLGISNVRNLSHETLHPGSGINLIYGNNGSGRTGGTGAGPHHPYGHNPAERGAWDVPDREYHQKVTAPRVVPGKDLTPVQNGDSDKYANQHGLPRGVTDQGSPIGDEC